ncbi:MAG: glycosyltransferase [Gemmatimonadota bacterium]|nr:MAG: glycosyltransferase [Gemmatimonadota bacterium]
MRLCILGNAQNSHVIRWAEFFSSRGHEVTIVSARPHELPGIQVYAPKLPFEDFLRRREIYDQNRAPNFAVYLSYILLALTVRRTVRRLSPDIVMAMTLETNGILAMIAGHHPTALYHLGNKALSVMSETSLVMRLLVKAMLRFSDMLHTGDSAGAARLRQLGAPADKIFINPWGVDLKQLHAEAGVAEVQEHLGASGKKLFACIRAFMPEYDIATFLRAIPDIVYAYPDTAYAVIGDGPERDKLTKLAEELDIRDYVTFVGYVPYDTLPAYTLAADFYVDPINFRLPVGRTWWGHRMRCSMDGIGYSITLMLGLASGCIPLVTRRAGLSDIFSEEQQRLLLWEPGNPTDLAQKAKGLLASHVDCQALRASLTQMAEERFDWQLNADRIEREYLDKIREHAGSVLEP